MSKIVMLRRGVVAGLAGGALFAPAFASELLVCSFSSDRVTSHTMSDGSLLGTYQSGVGLDGALCARIGPDGLLYVASEGSNTIQRYDPDTRAFVDTFVTAGSGGLNGPTGMTWDPNGDMYVASFNNDAVFKYDGGSGAPLGTFVASGANGLNGADNGITFGPDGNLYVPSYFGNRVQKYAPDGTFLGNVGGNIGRPRVMVFRGNDMFVTTETADAVRRIDWTTNTSLGNIVAPGAGGLDTPIGLAFDPNGDFLVTSLTGNNVLRFRGSDGAFVEVAVPAGTGGIDGPTFLTVIPEPSSVLLVGLVSILLARRH